jgi:hypothetical protein
MWSIMPFSTTRQKRALGLAMAVRRVTRMQRVPGTHLLQLRSGSNKGGALQPPPNGLIMT